jgi:hypothetical protein
MSAQLDHELQTIDFDLYELDLSGDNRTVENKRLFLTLYRQQGSVYHAAHEARIARSQVYKWLELDPAFAAALEDCKQDTYDIVESSVYRKAVEGSNPLLMMFWLKAKRPEFRDKVIVDLQAIDSEIKDRLAALQTQQFPPALALLQKGDDDSG